MIRFRNATFEDAKRCFQIETSAYSGEEAATFEKIATRIDQYADGFLILEVDRNVAGFINCGCTHDVKMSDEAFKELIGHDPLAPTVVIMSVAVDPSFQGRGLARVLMEEFIGRMTRLEKAEIHLMCQDHYVPMYEKFGFTYRRPSESDHGGKRWHEMSMLLEDQGEV